MSLRPVAPLLTVPLFPALNQALQAVLRGLSRSDWGRVTACDPWTVKDVAAHLLGGNFGRLWAPASGGQVVFQPIDFDALTAIINRENDVWVRAARRISPEQLIDVLARTDAALVEHFAALDPWAPAPIAVSWADDGPAPNWLDIAREYTEKWLHQQHIREAVGRPVLADPELFGPVLATFVHALPRALGSTAADDGTAVTVTITGPAGGAWSVVRQDGSWGLYVGASEPAACQVRMDQDTAWRMFTKGAVLSPAQIAGDPALGAAVLRAVAIMA